MDEGIEAEIDKLAEEHDRDAGELTEQFESARSEVEEKAVVEMEGAELDRAALRRVKADIQYQRRTGGEVEEVPIFALGNQGTMEWNDSDNGGKKEVVIASGIVAPDDLEDENRPAGPAVFICDETTGVDLGNIQEAFQWGNHLDGWFTLRKSEDFEDRTRTYYVASSGSETKVEETEHDNLPSDTAAKREFTHQYLKEDFEIAEVAENTSREGDDFGTSWLDLRRVTGQVVDAYRGDGFGKYVVIDDSVDGPVDLERLPYMTDDDVDNGRTPGLQVWIPPEFVQYGRDSTIELIGSVEKNSETGQINMNACAAIPLIPYPYEGNDGDGGGGDHDDVEAESV